LFAGDRTTAACYNPAVVDLRSAIAQHLRLALAAYGPDLVLPRGVAEPRPAAPAATDRPVADSPAADDPLAAPTVPVAPPARPADRTEGQTDPPLEPAGRRDASRTTAAAAPAAAGDAPGAAPGDAIRWATLQQQVEACQLCKLHEGRRRAVFGEGDRRAELMFVGEAPGANEDRTGRPFVGDAGKLLTAILNNAMGLRRAEVYIANINKCRPPANRTPTPDEAGACLPYLAAQVDLIRPKVIVCLGRTAAHHLLGREEPVGAMRGKDFEYLGIPVVVTWHPAYLLRDPSRKRETWADVMRVNRMLGRPERPTPVTDDAELA
jgi:DNA polymerase